MISVQYFKHSEIIWTCVLLHCSSQIYIFVYANSSEDLEYIDMFHGAYGVASPQCPFTFIDFSLTLYIFLVSAPRNIMNLRELFMDVYGAPILYIVFQCFFIATFVFSCKIIAFPQ